MKTPMRRLTFWIPATTCLTAAVIAACSSDDARLTFIEDHDADATTPTPPPPSDAEPDPNDAATPVDADAASNKAPFDSTDEPVVCATTPCAVQIVAGEGHLCARMSDGTVRCWGDNTKGSLGVETSPDAGTSNGGDIDAGDAGTPGVTTPVTALADVSQLSAGGTTTCAVVAGGDVHCWGGNDKGQLGLVVDPAATDTNAHPLASRVALPSAASRVDVGPIGACAVLTSGEIWCWGDNSQRQLARITTTTVAGPGKAVLGSFHVVRATAGTSTGFGLTDTGQILSWGAVAGTQAVVSARLASLSPDERPVAIGVGPATSFSVSSTTSSRAHACAVADGYVHCWGASSMGALGTGLPDSSPRPRRVTIESEKAWPQQVAAAGEITCARLTDGTVQCAGDNNLGVLGEDPKKATYSMLFRPVETFTGHAVQIATASRTACALLEDGSVVCWGSNQRGELGQGTTDPDPHPTPVSVRF
ncbi:hypothetical protein AKJ09_06857 [Labilithrix luteola]|uniref:BNR repeat domain protein n=1 Tax=Labilithrix luteola TaxID=1391654 RepID=A0A0K1Q352_9BACT|nr:RCC1 domain-containing protein [Labilithrix luteola]AKV00194.1 hypothetical protein AKJ09_06857 [Labilithrix luteola]